MNTTLHVIHLSRRTDRYSSLTDQINKQGITDYKIIEGIEDKPVRKGINRAFKSAITYAKENKLSNIIIAEDDIIFTHPNSYNFFLQQTPKVYDIFFGMIYVGEVNEQNRITSEFSAMTLCNVHSKFYDTFLSLSDDCYTDRALGARANEYDFIVCNPMCCYQSGSYSDHQKRDMDYSPYLEGKKMYKM